MNTGSALKRPHGTPLRPMQFQFRGSRRLPNEHPRYNGDDTRKAYAGRGRGPDECSVGDLTTLCVRVKYLFPDPGELATENRFRNLGRRYIRTPSTMIRNAEIQVVSERPTDRLVSRRRLCSPLGVAAHIAVRSSLVLRVWVVGEVKFVVDQLGGAGVCLGGFIQLSSHHFGRDQAAPSTRLGTSPERLCFYINFLGDVPFSSYARIKFRFFSAPVRIIVGEASS